MAIVSPREGKNAYKRAPESWGELREWCRLNAEVANQAMEGKINSTGTVTLTANQTTTVITDERIGPNSVILLMPTTANAAGESATLYVSSRGEKTATFTHANAATVDRSFAYAVFG